MENKFKLKKFLATASAFAMITSASSAMAAQQKTDGGGVAVLEDAVNGINAVSHPGNAVAVWGANDSFFLNSAHDVTIGANVNAATVATFDVNNQAGRTITVSEDSSIASIINSTGAQTIALAVEDGIELTFGGAAGLNVAAGAQAAGDFSGLGNIVLGTEVLVVQQ